jgi:predicted ArsR family transcriptional regulator
MSATHMNEIVEEALKNGPLSMDELARELRFDCSASMRTLRQHMAWMERRGYVEVVYHLGTAQYELK